MTLILRLSHTIPPVSGFAAEYELDYFEYFVFEIIILLKWWYSYEHILSLKEVRKAAVSGNLN